jgi:hypothetical protein
MYKQTPHRLDEDEQSENASVGIVRLGAFWDRNASLLMEWTRRCERCACGVAGAADGMEATVVQPAIQPNADDLNAFAWPICRSSYASWKRTMGVGNLLSQFVGAARMATGGRGLQDCANGSR